MNNAKVVTLNTDVAKLTDDKWSIKGDTARKIIAARDNCLNVRTENEARANAAKTAMWSIINSALKVDQKENLQLNTEHEDAGILFISREKDGTGPIIHRLEGSELLATLFGSILKD